MTKQELEQAIFELNLTAEKLAVEQDEIRGRYDRPSQWMKDQRYRAIAAEQTAIQEASDELWKDLNTIKDQEWIDSLES